MSNHPLFFNAKETAWLKGSDLMPIMKITADSMYKDFETLHASIPNWKASEFDMLF
jgi:hypothetical protein